MDAGESQAAQPAARGAGAPAADLKTLEPQTQQPQVAIEPALVRPQRGLHLAFEAYDRPVLPQGPLEIGQRLPDQRDQRALVAEIDRPLASVFAVAQAVVRAVGPRAPPPPRGHNAPLPGEQFHPPGDQRQRRMSLLVNKSVRFQFHAPRPVLLGFSLSSIPSPLFTIRYPLFTMPWPLLIPHPVAQFPVKNPLPAGLGRLSPRGGRGSMGGVGWRNR